MPAEKLSTYKIMINDSFVQIEKSLGSHVVLLILEHAHWRIKEKYEEAELIQYAEDGVSLDGLDSIAMEKAERVAHDFIMEIIASLGRLVGKEMASKLTKYLHD